MSILIYGASGFTGSLIAHALVKAGHRPILAGRDRARLGPLATTLGKLEVRMASVSDPASLARALDGVQVLINCAGPFLRLGEPVLRAAIEQGVHYLDTTGEQAFMRDTFERYESQARRTGSVVTSGMAFEIALGDWAASAAAAAVRDGNPERVIDEILIGYSLESLHPTRGTRLSAVEAMTAPGCEWRNGRWDEVALAAEARRFEFAGGSRLTTSFPSGEVISVPRSTGARRVQTFVSFSQREGIARATRLFAPLLGPLLRTPLAAVARARASDGPNGPTDEQRRDGHFEICAEARSGADKAIVSVSGTDVYGITAEISAAAAIVLLAREQSGDAPSIPAGFRTPSQLWPAASALAGFADSGRLTVSSRVQMGDSSAGKAHEPASGVGTAP